MRMGPPGNGGYHSWLVSRSDWISRLASSRHARSSSPKAALPPTAIMPAALGLPRRATPALSWRAARGGGYSAIAESNLVGPEGGRVLVERTVKLINSLWPQP